MTVTQISTQLPHWDMTPVFPSLDSPEFTSAFDQLVASIAQVKTLFDAANIRKASDPAVDDATLESFETIVGLLNDVADRFRTLRAYVHAFVATEAQNDLAQARNSELQMHAVETDKLEKRLVAWLGSVDTESVIQRSAVARDHAFFIRRCRREAEHQMSEGEEDLSSGLGPDRKSVV